MEQEKKKSKIWMVVLVTIVVIALGLLGWFFGRKYLEKKDSSSNSNKEGNNQNIDVALYQACDEDSCIYLLGSIHLGDERILNLPTKVWDAYNESDALAVEVDITEISEETQEKMLSLLMLPEDDDLSNYFTAEQFAALESFFKKQGLDINGVRLFTLAGISSTMSELLYQSYPIPGVDSQLLLRAKAEEKEIIELESYDFQMDLLYGKKDEEYVESIMEIIEHFDEEKKGVTELYEAYVSANIPELEKILFEGAEENEEEYKVLFYDRNVPMAEKAEGFLKENKNVMITVGAGHVIGDKGIVKLLQEKGYKVTLVK